jgi:hypothetical protein
MKKIFTITAAILLYAASFSQTTIKFKGKDFIIAGQSAGAIKGKNDNPVSYECYWDVNTDTKTIRGTTVQTFKNDVAGDGKDIEVRTALLSDLNLELLDTGIHEDTLMFSDKVYPVSLYTKENQDLVKSWSCYRFSEGDKLEATDNVWNIQVVFARKEDAQAFIQTVKSIK